MRGTKRQAEEVLGELLTQLREGSLVHARGMTMAELLERWLVHNEEDLSPKTVLEVRGVMATSDSRLRASPGPTHERLEGNRSSTRFSATGVHVWQQIGQKFNRVTVIRVIEETHRYAIVI